jgi:hypothetical protein
MARENRLIMKTGKLAILAAVALAAAGCVSTVTDEQPGSMPAYRDRIDAHYDQPLNKVYAAAKRALNSYGNITREGSLLVSGNEVLTLEGLLNQKRVWMRAEATKPGATKVTIQIRAPMGGTDLEMARELEKQIAFELTP